MAEKTMLGTTGVQNQGERGVRPGVSPGGGPIPSGAPSSATGETALRVAKTLKREAESLWDVPPDTYSSRVCGRLSVPAQLVAVAVLGSFQFGYNLAALNTSKAFVVLDFGWCKYENGNHYIGCDKGLLYGSLVTTAVFAGAAIGCLVGGRVTDFGRRMALLSTHCLCMLGSGLSAGAEGFVSLLLARLVVGLAVGLFTVCVPMYIAEVTPDTSRGFFGTFHQLFITVGIFCGTVLGLAFGEAPADNTVYEISNFQRAWWRVLLGMPLVVSACAIILYLWVFSFETPNFMMEKKQKVKAAALLREIYRRDDVDAEMHRLLQGHYEMKIQRAQQLNLWKAIVHHSAYRNVIIIACLLSMFQQFSGINVLVANSNNLYASLKLPQSTITGLSVGFAALNVVLTVVTVPLVDTLGRRTLLLFSMILQFLAMAVAFVANLVDRTSTAVQWTTVACVYVFIVGFAVGYGPILWIYLHEIFPPEIKQGAAGLASALNWVATICIVLPSDFLLNSSFTVFVGLCTGALLFILIVTFFFVKETKGLSIEESPYFKGKRREISASAFADKLSQSFFYGAQPQQQLQRQNIEDGTHHPAGGNPQSSVNNPTTYLRTGSKTAADSAVAHSIEGTNAGSGSLSQNPNRVGAPGFPSHPTGSADAPGVYTAQSANQHSTSNLPMKSNLSKENCIPTNASPRASENSASLGGDGAADTAATGASSGLLRDPAIAHPHAGYYV